MNKLKRHLLRALLACDGEPMPEEALCIAAQLLARPAEPTLGDLAAALKSLEADGYAEGVSDDITGRTWTLTDKGTHKARQL